MAKTNSENGRIEAIDESLLVAKYKEAKEKMQKHTQKVEKEVGKQPQYTETELILAMYGSKVLGEKTKESVCRYCATAARR